MGAVGWWSLGEGYPPPLYGPAHFKPGWQSA